MRVHAVTAVSAMILSFAPTHASTSSYTEGGKTYHKPAVISTKQLVNYSKYTDRQKKLTLTALESIPSNKWLKYKFGGASPSAYPSAEIIESEKTPDHRLKAAADCHVVNY